MLLQPPENLMVSVADHYGAQGESHDEERERLQAIEVAQGIPPEKDSIDYSSGGAEGSAAHNRHGCGVEVAICGGFDEA
jgi:hypothetical protein